MRALWKRTVLVGFLLAACQGKPEKSPPPVKPPAPVEGMAAIPAAARTLVSVDVAALARVPLVNALVARTLERTPDLGRRLRSLLAACHVDPRRDVQHAWLGLGDSADQVALVVEGTLDQRTIVGCLGNLLARKGGKLEPRQLDGAPAWVALDPESHNRVWLCFGSARTLILAGSEKWLRAARAPAGPKAGAVPAVRDALSRIDQSSALWAVSVLRPREGRQIATLAGGTVKHPARSILAHVDLSHGVVSRVDVEMGNSKDAKAMVAFATRELPLLQALVRGVGLGEAMTHIEIRAEGRLVRGSLSLGDKALTRIQSQLASSRRTLTTEQGASQ